MWKFWYHYFKILFHSYSLSLSLFLFLSISFSLTSVSFLFRSLPSFCHFFYHSNTLSFSLSLSVSFDLTSLSLPLFSLSFCFSFSLYFFLFRSPTIKLRLSLCLFFQWLTHSNSLPHLLTYNWAEIRCLKCPHESINQSLRCQDAKIISYHVHLRFQHHRHHHLCDGEPGWGRRNGLHHRRQPHQGGHRAVDQVSRLYLYPFSV